MATSLLAVSPLSSKKCKVQMLMVMWNEGGKQLPIHLHNPLYTAFASQVPVLLRGLLYDFKGLLPSGSSKAVGPESRARDP